jgi:F0F1-type ATP synthase beta subunit
MGQRTTASEIFTTGILRKVIDLLARSSAGQGGAVRGAVGGKRC